MPNGLGSFGPSVASGALVTAAPSAVFSGTLQGFKNGSIKSSEFFEQGRKAENLFKSIQEIIKAIRCDPRNIDGEFSGLNIFQDALNAGEFDFFPTVNSTRMNIASIPEIISEGVLSIASHSLQAVSDSLIASKVASSIQRPKSMEDIFLPSKLEENARANFFACCKHFTNQANPTEQLHEKVHLEFVNDHESVLESHKSGAILTADGIFASTSGAPMLIGSLLWDTLGSTFRNLYESGRYTTNIRDEEAKVFSAINACIGSMSEVKPSRESCFKSLENLNSLIKELADVKPSSDQMSDDLVTGGKPISKLLSFATIPFVSSLKLVVDSALGLMLASDVVEKKLASPDSKVLSQNASSLERKHNPESSHSHSENIFSLTQQFKNINQALNIMIAEDKKLQHSASDASSVLAVGGASTFSHSVMLLLPVVLTELGSVTQETAAGLRFSMNGSNKIFHECDITSESNQNTGEDVDRLFQEAINTRDALEMMKDLGNSSPFILGLTQAGVCGAAVGTLEILLGAYSAIKEMRSAPQTIRNIPSEFKEEEKKQLNNSVQEIKASHQKISSALSTSAPKHLSAEGGIESIIKKVLLTGCMSQSENNELKDRKDLNSVGKVSVQTENSIASGATHFGGFLTGALSAIAFVTLESGISTEAFIRAMGNTLLEILHSYEHIKESSEGPDKIKLSSNSNTNLSSLSNALRLLTAAKSDDLPSLQKSSFSMVKFSESITSRSFTIFLMHSGILVDAIMELVRQHENQEEKTQSIRRTKAAAHEEVMSGLARVIEEKLNQLDAKAIPGLNKDIAAQVQSFSQQRIVSALTSEMSLVEPFLVLGHISQDASRDDNPFRHDDEALMKSSVAKQVSRVSNMIQGFTLACVEEASHTHDHEDQTLLKTNLSFKNSSNISFMSSGYSSLSLVELIGTVVGRSFTLLNSDEIKVHSEQVSEHSIDNLKGNFNLSTAEVKADSHCGENGSGIYSISALRSTLTHFCAALKGCADELAIEVSKMGDEDFMKDGLRMHASQKTLMRSVEYAFTQCASLITRVLAVGSGLTFSHILLLGKVDKLHDLLHSNDKSLEPHQSKGGQQSTHDCGSDISLSTGLSTDLIASTLTNLVKILLSASLIGADVVLSVAKILEILILDVHPSNRLRQEWQALSVPDVKSGGMSKASKRTLKSTEVIPTISLGQLSVSHDAEFSRSTLENSFHSLQNRVDNLIDQMQVLEDNPEGADEKWENVITLKKYISHIIKTLNKHISDENCETLITRFNKGGMALSGYHSLCGGILNFSEAKEDRLLRIVKNTKLDHINNTNVLIEKFIDELFQQYSQFLKSNNEDPIKKFMQSFDSTLSLKARNLHDYIIRGVANKLYESHNLIRSTFWHAPKISFNRDGFVAKYSIQSSTNSLLINSQDVDIIPSLESSMLKAEEARAKRAESRALQEQDNKETQYSGLHLNT